MMLCALNHAGMKQLQNRVIDKQKERPIMILVFRMSGCVTLYERERTIFAARCMREGCFCRRVGYCGAGDGYDTVLTDVVVVICTCDVWMAMACA